MTGTIIELQQEWLDFYGPMNVVNIKSKLKGTSHLACLMYSKICLWAKLLALCSEESILDGKLPHGTLHGSIGVSNGSTGVSNGNIWISNDSIGVSNGSIGISKN